MVNCDGLLHNCSDLLSMLCWCVCVAQGSAGLWTRGSNAVHVNSPAFDPAPQTLVCVLSLSVVLDCPLIY